MKTKEETPRMVAWRMTKRVLDGERMSPPYPEDYARRLRELRPSVPLPIQVRIDACIAYLRSQGYAISTS